MTTRTLLLLAGLHKTGTTSIQATCRVNVERLAATGWFYPLFDVADDRRVGRPENHSRFINPAFRETSMMLGAPRPTGELYLPNTARAEYRSALDAELRKAGDRDVLLVAEGVSTLTLNGMRELRQYLHAKGFRLRVYCCVRQLASWLNSMVAQRCAGEYGPRLTLRGAVTEMVAVGSIVQTRLENLERAFPETTFFDFGDSAHHPTGPPGRFLEMIGIDATGWVFVQANRGSSDPAVRLHSAINAAVGHRALSRQHLKFYGALAQDHLALWEVPGPRFTLRKREAAQLAALLEQEERWLRSRFGAAFSVPHLPFSEEPIMLDEVARQFIAQMLTSLSEPLRGIVQRYLATR